MQTGIAVAASLAFLLANVFQGCAAPLTREGLSKENVPALKRDCSPCHLLKDGGGIEPVLRKPVAGLCIGCHADRRSPGDHKTGVAPAKASTRLPLLDGKMTCVTCHDPHRNTYPPMLRVRSEELCLLCHDT